ncbi:carboxypeptidase-like regulatory domain-containing protein [Actinoplanes sp. NPDC051513]|uniref:carboxypeptidase-like regulatory domain-containing protein n=1 Tax=Actinoplanes sp. NPDC051513 TaxID=3363908 RepID=UPI003796CE95
MPRAPLRPLTAAVAVVLAVAPAACGSGAPSASPYTRTISRQPAASATSLPAPTTSPPAPTTSPPAPTTSASAGTLPTTAPPPTGAGLRGRTVVLNCPADRADPPCPGTPVRARVVVLNRTGQTTLATADTGADGWFTVALPAGSYVIRAAPIGARPARRPTIRQVTVSAGHYTTITIRLITGLR